MRGYTADNKMVIRCKHCLGRMRAPLDKGKISITCPLCKKGFLYNPDSILDTCRQIYLAARAQLRKIRKP